MYDDVVNENIPDDFMSFLEKADERIAGADKSDASNAQSEVDPARKKA